MIYLKMIFKLIGILGGIVDLKFNSFNSCDNRFF